VPHRRPTGRDQLEEEERVKENSINSKYWLKQSGELTKGGWGGKKREGVQVQGTAEFRLLWLAGSSGAATSKGEGRHQGRGKRDKPHGRA